MNRIMIKKYVYIVIIGVLALATSCSATKQHTLSALEPASVDLATNITKIGIINESTASRRSEFKTRLEQMLSQRDHNLEKEGISAAITGLFEELQKDQRFDAIQLIADVKISGEGLVTSENIPWQTIKEICDTHKVDAIFSLAYYEADTQLSLKKTAVKEQNMMRQMVKVPGHEVTLETLIENGWRIYDPYHQTVLDELVFNEQITSSAQGTNPVYALNAITDRRDAVLEQSMQAGSSYGKRLLPQEKELVREYYIRGTEKFMEAKRLAAEGNWEAAAVLWEQETAHTTIKIQAKACYNMAFYNEMNDNLEGAMEWAQKASDLDENTAATAYLLALKERMAQNKIITQQLQRSQLSASLEME